jgi:kynurenine formamidase
VLAIRHRGRAPGSYPDRYPYDGQFESDRATLAHRITPCTDLNNLKEVVNQRFDFFAFPLKLVPAAGSPILDVGIVDDYARRERFGKRRPDPARAPTRRVGRP